MGREQVHEAAMQQTERVLGVSRQHEGYLISVPGHPVLIVAFGSKYSGVLKKKYMAFGIHDVPVGFISSIKVDGMPAILMTREGRFGPEFQIILLPKSSVRPRRAASASACCMLQ